MSQRPNICLSGGAEGADVVWGAAAEAVGHEIVHWSFNGHKADTEWYLCELNTDQLRVADPFLELANKSIHRRWPSSNIMVNNLLRRNFYQIYWSDSVYAVSSFTNDTSVLKISGGTAWACQMFVDRWLYTTPHLTSIPLYFFDQISKNWYTWTGQWNMIDLPPRPSGVYAGIGSRKLTDEGRQAILSVYG